MNGALAASASLCVVATGMFVTGLLNKLHIPEAGAGGFLAALAVGSFILAMRL